MTPFWKNPLSCSDDVTGKLKLSLLLSNCCPINLMGRVVMCLLGICLVSTSKGVIVIGTSDTHILVKYSPDTLLYVYEWKLCTSAVTSVNTALVDNACSHSTQTTCNHKIYTALHTYMKGEMQSLRKDGSKKVA